MSKTQGAVGWHKSSYSAQNGQCIEQGIMTTTGKTAVRDTKNNGVGKVLKFDPSAWSTFVDSVR
jgi:hypothetical protein